MRRRRFDRSGAARSKKQIVQVFVLQSAKVVAGIYLIIAIPASLLAALTMSLTHQNGFSFATLVLLPMLYAFFGFLGALIAGWIYNVVAARIGGIEFTTAEVNAVSH